MTITRDMIIGAKITDVYSTLEVKDDLDYSAYFFRTDRGFDFSLPYGGSPWKTVQIPSTARLIEDRRTISSFSVLRSWFGRQIFRREPDTVDDVIYRLKQPSIAQVLCDPFDAELGFRPPYEATLIMSDGSTLGCTAIAPHGTGGAGLYYRSASDSSFDASAMDDYFTIPLDQEQTPSQNETEENMDGNTSGK